ncbi:transposase [Bradyrhizobium sp. WYCCWR 13023]|uniref:Transposase n=1 Tax=Bradyrhizobium zhengyangense TaxID=2911009 RepID=A0A9X1RK82_9BRAD|nr:transposase [Bradyrhizobium zhengyangense]
MARRHGSSQQQLFGWRRQLREAASGRSEADEVQFVPTAVDAVAPAPTAHRERKAVRRPDSGIIEIEVDGITIRAGRGADTAMIASIVRSSRP